MGTARTSLPALLGALLLLLLLTACADPAAGPEPDAGPACVHPKVVEDCQQGWCTIPAGCFVMGSPVDEDCRETQHARETRHRVTLTRAFEIGETVVTQQMFSQLMGYNPSFFRDIAGQPPCGDNCPVEQVTWNEAAAYCNALSKARGLPRCYSCTGARKETACVEAPGASKGQVYACRGYRLPTDAEWEYAYRAGTTTALYNGPTSSCTDKDQNADRIGWYLMNADLSTHPVALKRPNAWGLYDMAGLVMEWCHDQRVDDLGSAPVRDPWGAVTGPQRLARGGSFMHGAGQMRAAFRSFFKNAHSCSRLGFRCVLGR